MRPVIKIQKQHPDSAKFKRNNIKAQEKIEEFTSETKKLKCKSESST